MNIGTIKVTTTRERITSNSTKEEVIYTVECPQEFIEMFGKEKALDETSKRCLEFLAFLVGSELMEENEDEEK